MEFQVFIFNNTKLKENQDLCVLYMGVSMSVPVLYMCVCMCIKQTIFRNGRDGLYSHFFLFLNNKNCFLGNRFRQSINIPRYKNILLRWGLMDCIRKGATHEREAIFFFLHFFLSAFTALGREWGDGRERKNEEKTFLLFFLF